MQDKRGEEDIAKSGFKRNKKVENLGILFTCWLITIFF
jgi:hypothetical protein